MLGGTISGPEAMTCRIVPGSCKPAALSYQCQTPLSNSAMVWQYWCGQQRTADVCAICHAQMVDRNYTFCSRLSCIRMLLVESALLLWSHI